MTAGTLAACLTAIVAVLAAWPRTVIGDPTPRPGRMPVALRATGWQPMLLVAVMAGLVLAARAGAGPVSLVGIAGAAAVVVGERRRAARRADRRDTAARVEEALAVLSADLAAGRSPSEALAGAAEVAPDLLEEAARTWRLGGSPAQVLAHAAQREGAGALRQLRSAWLLVEQTGAPAADVLSRVSVGVRAELAAIREVDEQLAPVRATARVLAVLPLAGLALGALVGVNVPALLVGTGWGQVCLTAAVGLVAAGLTTVDRIAERATHQR